MTANPNVYLLGDWNGARTGTGGKGNVLRFFYIADRQANPTGGLKQAQAGWERIRGTVDVNCDHIKLWDEQLLDSFGIADAMLPRIRSSSEIYGHSEQPSIKDVPKSGILGDQQGALVEQACLEPGDANNTYGTGCFLLMNTGTQKVDSTFGLLTTMAYKLGDQPVVYASGEALRSLVRWCNGVRDNLGLINESSDIEALARTVNDKGGVYFVPVFSGLYAPH